ncbi:MAG: hypothetical protein ACRCY4_02420 [Brevinema sp.]
MTLAEFLSDVCKEVLAEYSPSTKSGAHKGNSQRKLITESCLQEMINKDLIHTLKDSDLMTPSAKDLLYKYRKGMNAKQKS